MEVNFHNKCRACLSENDAMLSLFEVYEHDLTLAIILQSFIAAEVSETDGMPSHLCESCTTVLIQFYNFTVVYEESDQKLQKLLKDSKKHIPVNQSRKLEENLESLDKAAEPEEEVETNELLNEKVAVEVSQKEVMTNCSVPATLEYYEYKTSSNGYQEQEGMHVPNYSSEDVETIQEFTKKVPEETEGMNGDPGYVPPADMLKLHEDKKKYVCEVCGARFIRKTYLYDHMEVHSTEKKHECKFCGKTFRLRTVLLAHKRVHTHPNQYLCEQCGRAFTSSSTLKTHKLSIHVKARNFQCVICNLTFSLKYTLNKHVLRHQKKENGEKDFNCTQCEMQYRDKYSLKRHVDTKHQGLIQLHGCSDCPKKYTSKGNLMKHRKRHHSATVVEIVL